MIRYAISFLSLFLVECSAFAQDLNEKNEQTMKAAAAKVAPSVVKIETAGGTDSAGAPAGGVRKGRGPTTGVIVAADGYILTSAFNFANKPSDIFVTIPGRPARLVAKVIANDTTRMLTLLKVDAKDLPLPVAVKNAELQVGQWSLALGRALMPEVDTPPSMSAGIISALGRISGKAIQTDAKVSPVNYGGPLIAIDGRVQGILVPASPRGEAETAGVEWYDSGIGFAIPLEDIFAILPKLREGKDLRRGLIGITSQSQELYLDDVVVGRVNADSAAAKAGIKVGDKVVSIDGKPVANYTQLMHIMGPKYEGDTVAIKVIRDSKEMEFPTVKLSGAVTAFANPFIGILPMRDDPELGVEIRFVFPQSPAEEAGLKPGDRILKIAPVVGAPGQPVPQMAVIQGRTQMSTIVNKFAAGDEVKIEVKRKDGGKTETKTLRLTAVPETLPVALPLPSTFEKALDKPKTIAGGPMAVPVKPKDPPKADEKKDDDKKEPELGLLKRKNATLGREYWMFVPLNYKPNISHGVIIWLHPLGKGGKDADDMVKIWRPFLEDFHYIMVGPKAQSNDGWVASETEGVVQDVKEVFGQYTIDRSRVIAHGMGVGGQMCFYLGFNARDTIRGVATTGASLGTQPKDNLPNQPLSFYIVGGEKDPAIKTIAESKPALVDKRFPVIYRQLKDFGKEYMLQETLLELCVWIDSLDKI